MKRLSLYFFALIVIFIKPHISSAQTDWGPTLNYNVKPGATIRIMRQYMVGNYCGFSAPQITAFKAPQLGTLSFDKKQERIAPNTNLGGDGHSYCDKPTGVTYVYYKAGINVGSDTFELVTQFGNATRFNKVSINVSGAMQKSNERAEPSQTPKVNQNSEKQISKPLKLNELPPANEYFNNIRIGSSFDYDVMDEITKKRSTMRVTITDKNEREIAANVNGGSLTVFNVTCP